MLTRLRYLTLILTLSVLLTLYLTILVTVPVVDQIITDSDNEDDIGQKSVMREVVAFSLRKTIEIESKEVHCDRIEKVAGTFRRENPSRLWYGVPDTDLYVFGVYYDDRLEPFRYLRVLGMVKGSWNRTIYCQIQSENGTIHITKANRKEIWLKEWDAGDEDTFNPILLSCYLPINVTPRKLYININPCELNNLHLPLTPNEAEETNLHSLNWQKKYTTTICVKPLKFTEDISKRLMQWIEINRILGADKFEIFIDKVHDRVYRLLKFYQRKYKGKFLIREYENIEDFISNELSRSKNTKKWSDGAKEEEGYDLINENFVSDSDGSLPKKFEQNGHHPAVSLNKVEKEDEEDDVGIGLETSTTVSISYDDDDDNDDNTENTQRKIWQKRRNEVITYNDCLYRNLRSSHFVIPVDVDEIIVPRQFYTWNDLLGHLFLSNSNLYNEFASFSVRNVYFLEEFSSIKKHRMRKREKSFFFEYNERSEFSKEGESGKSFVSTKNTLTVFNHYTLEILKPGIRKIYFLPRKLVQMNHYKRTCSVNLLPECAKYLSSPVRILDTLIHKYKKEFVENYHRTLKELGNLFSV